MTRPKPTWEKEWHKTSKNILDGIEEGPHRAKLNIMIYFCNKKASTFLRAVHSYGDLALKRQQEIEKHERTISQIDEKMDEFENRKRIFFDAQKEVINESKKGMV